MEQLNELKNRIDRLENLLGSHGHDGINTPRIQIDDLQNTISVVSAVPSHIPRDFFEQILIYKNGTTYRLYWHDGTGWRYATGTMEQA